MANQKVAEGELERKLARKMHPQITGNLFVFIMFFHSLVNISFSQIAAFDFHFLHLLLAAAVPHTLQSKQIHKPHQKH